MRPQYLTAAQNLKRARDAAIVGDRNTATREFKGVLALLSTLPPERTRDILLAHAHLGHYQTLTLSGGSSETGGKEGGAQARAALEALHLGISYARSTRDPIARAIAEECLEGLDVSM